MNWYKQIIFLPVLMIIYIFLLFYFDLQQISKVLEEIDLHYFVLSLGIWGLGLLIRVFRWHLLFQNVSKKILFKHNVLYYLSGLSMVFSPGKVGEIIRLPYIKRDYEIPISKSISVVIAERYYEIVAIITIIGIALFFIDIPKIILIIPALTVIALILVITKKNFCIKLLNRSHKIKFIGKFLPDINETVETLFSFFHTKIFIKSIMTSLAIYLIDAIGFFYLLKSLHVDLDLMLVTAIVHSSFLISSLSMIPGGIGVWEGGFITMLVTNGISNQVAIAASLLFRLVFTGAFSIIGLFSLRLISNKKIN